MHSFLFAFSKLHRCSRPAYIGGEPSTEKPLKFTFLRKADEYVQSKYINGGKGKKLAAASQKKNISQETISCVQISPNNSHYFATAWDGSVFPPQSNYL